MPEKTEEGLPMRSPQIGNELLAFTGLPIGTDPLPLRPQPYVRIPGRAKTSLEPPGPYALGRREADRLVTIRRVVGMSKALEAARAPPAWRDPRQSPKQYGGPTH